MIDNDDGNNVDGNLQHFIGARLDSRHKMSGTERNLLHLKTILRMVITMMLLMLRIMIIMKKMKKMDADLGKIVSWVPVKGELANRDKGEVSMRPNLIFFFNIFFENNPFV